MEDALNKARSLLADVHNQSQKGRFQDSKQAADTLCCTLHLLQILQSFLVKETVSLDPSSPEWKVLKALIELLIRLGISPYLSPGVGILRDTSSSALAHTSSITMQFSDLSISNPLSQSSAWEPLSDLPVLFVCAEALASFIWNTSSATEMARSLPFGCPFMHRGGTHSKDAKLPDTSMQDFGAFAPDGHKPGMNTRCSSTNLGDSYVPLFPSIAQLAMKFFLWDCMAAYLQLGFGPKGSGKNAMVCSDNARARLKDMVEHFPVEQMIVASFVLLNRESPAPPPWIKVELGKQLSKLVMRPGGLITVMKELVGQVTKGNVESYDKVAGHLAKVPKSVATSDEYFKAICPQLLPLLLFRHKPKDLVMGETSLTALSNVYHAALSLTCKLFYVDSVLAKKYVVQPLIRPLLALNFMQEKMSMDGVVSLKHSKKQQIELLVTENEVVDSLVQLGVLLTAGSHGSSAAREAILLEARGVASLLIKLHFQLTCHEDPNPMALPGSNKSAKCALKDLNTSASESKGITKGLLQRGLGSGELNEQAYEHESTLSKLKSSLADVVMAEVNQSAELALPCILSFLLEHEMVAVRWPREEGEVWKAFQCKAFDSGSKAMYLSRLLLMVENWHLVLAIMGEVLCKILKLRQLLIKSDGSVAADLLRCMHVFEELNNEAGAKALEHDTHGASSLLKALLDDELVLSDEDMLELVLHMVNSLLKGIHASRSDDAQTNHEHEVVLNDLLSSIERVYGDACVGEKLRQMSFTLAEEVRSSLKQHI